MKRWTSADLASFEAELLRRRRRLMEDLEAQEAAGSADVSERASMSSQPADLGADREASDISLARRSAESTEIQEIDDALDRIRDGTFGVCEECEGPISRERLDAIPYGRLCLACRKRVEGTA